MGLAAMPLRALLAASSAPDTPPPAPSSRDSAMHSELVTTMSTMIITITGPTLLGPISAASSGTPMNPVLGNAATKAPMEASFQRMRSFSDMATANATITSAHSKYTPNTEASSNCAIGVVEPNRYNMHGSAKNNTKPFRPGMAANGNMPRRAATKPHNTSAKKGNVTHKMFSTGALCQYPMQSRQSPCILPCYDEQPTFIAFSQCLIYPLIQPSPSA